VVLNLTAYQHGVRVHQNRGFSEQLKEWNYGKHATSLFEGYKRLLVNTHKQWGFLGRHLSNA